MPLYDFDCPNCEERVIDEYITCDEIMDHVQLCPICKTEMAYDPRRRQRKSFVPFIAEHLTRLEGKPVLIESLHQLRKLEKKHEDQQLCCEAYSYDSKYGKEDYTKNPVQEDHETDLRELLEKKLQGR